MAILNSDGAAGCVIRRNWIENEGGRNIGIWAAENASVTIRDNPIIGFGRGISGVGSGDVSGNVLWLSEPIAGSIAVALPLGVHERNLIVGDDKPE